MENLLSLYLGIDVAGAKNTWFAALSDDGAQLKLAMTPHIATLPDIVAFTNDHDVLAAAIDAQLSIAMSNLTGFRSADTELRELLPPHHRNWVASVNSLMAVPIRGQMLADAISPSVATIIETHPRASLYFGCPPDHQESIANYKREPGAAECVRNLWAYWSAEFGLTDPLGNDSDGALDAVVCATIAYLCHNDPSRLFRLRHNAVDRRGHGPFYILHPDQRPNAGT